VPELPEVETVRAGLERHVVGRTVATATVLNPRAVRRDPAGPEGFAAVMAARPLRSAQRRGKYLWLALDADEALLAHLGMSGQLLVGDPERPLSPHVRARFTFTDGGPDLRFTDQRTFGHLMLCSLRGDQISGMGGPAPHAPWPPAPPGMGGLRPPISPPREDAQNTRAPRAVAEVKAPWLRSAGTAEPAVPRAVAGVRPAVVGVRPGRLVPEPIAHIAADPLEAAFDAAVFTARLTRRRTGVKRALLDQSLVSGIGNIYADEALWRARLHWARPTEVLRPGEVSRLLDAVHEVLTEALKVGGTSFDALYVNVNGESGYFDRSLNAYGQEGKPCGRCATPIRRDAFMNRSAYSCPRCQPRPRSAHR
jgi:formamidopyrimidine-DNA glycosylase